VPKKTRGPLAY